MPLGKDGTPFNNHLYTIDTALERGLTGMPGDKLVQFWIFKVRERMPAKDAVLEIHRGGGWVGFGDPLTDLSEQTWRLKGTVLYDVSGDQLLRAECF